MSQIDQFTKRCICGNQKTNFVMNCRVAKPAKNCCMKTNDLVPKLNGIRIDFCAKHVKCVVTRSFAAWLNRLYCVSQSIQQQDNACGVSFMIMDGFDTNHKSPNIRIVKLSFNAIPLRSNFLDTTLICFQQQLCLDQFSVCQRNPSNIQASK